MAQKQAKVSVERNVLKMELPLVPIKDAPLSSSGKAKVVFSTRGWMDVPGQEGVKMRLSLNVIADKDAK